MSAILSAFARIAMRSFKQLTPTFCNLSSERKVTGLRIDHIDGLLDPKAIWTGCRDNTS